MRTRLSLVAGLFLALASTCFAQQSAPTAAAGYFVPLALPPALVRAPDDKNQNPVLEHAWTTKAVDANGLRAVVSFPSEWMVRDQPFGTGILELHSVNGRRFSAILLSSFGPAPISLNVPLRATRLAEFSRGMSGRGITVNAAGQAKLGSRYWIWVDAVAPDAILRPPAENPGDPAFDPFRIWTFTTTDAGRIIQVNFTVGMPKGSTAEDTDAEVHGTGDVFLEMLKRMTFEPGQSQPAAPPADTRPFPENVARVSQSGVTAPVVVTQIQPRYTVDAMRARISGAVVLECVVETDGTVEFVRVQRSLDAVNGLDDEAVKAAKQWRFRPGTKDGVPVRVLVTIELSFTLRSTPPPQDGK